MIYKKKQIDKKKQKIVSLKEIKLRPEQRYMIIILKLRMQKNLSAKEIR